MNACARFEEEGLSAIEAGVPLDEHFDECPDCRTERAEYRRLGEALAEVGGDYRPPGDWQARVWSEVRRSQARKRRRWLWTLAPAALAAALVAAVLLRPPMAEAPTLLASVEAGGGPARRGTEAQPGDRLNLEATTGGREHVELRVYRNDRELVLRCSDQPPCERTRGGLRASLELAAIGSYQAVFLASEAPLPAPSGDLDADAGAALRAGVAVELPKPIQVR